MANEYVIWCEINGLDQDDPDVIAEYEALLESDAACYWSEAA